MGEDRAALRLAAGTVLVKGVFALVQETLTERLQESVQ